MWMLPEYLGRQLALRLCIRCCQTAQLTWLHPAVYLWKDGRYMICNLRCRFRLAHKHENSSGPDAGCTAATCTTFRPFRHGLAVITDITLYVKLHHHAPAAYIRLRSLAPASSLPAPRNRPRCQVVRKRDICVRSSVTIVRPLVTCMASP